MSRELIAAMYDGHVFDSMLLEADMADFHVPFDDLRHERATESVLHEAVRRFERVALTGEAGSGKTSVARYVLESPPKGILSIWAPLAYKDDTLATEPARFAENLVDVLSAYAFRTSRLTADQRDDILRAATPEISLPTTSRRRGGDLGLAAWVVHGGLAGDVTRTIEGGRVPRSERDILQRANEVLETIRAYALEPVIVMDDTDRLIGRLGADQLIPVFFGSVMRSVVEQLRAGVVVAAQPFYLDRDDYRHHTSGIVERHLSIPALPDEAAVASILSARIRYVEPDAGAGDAFASDAVAQLFEVYRRQDVRTIRALLAAAHAALTRGKNADAGVITIEHVLAGADDALLS